MMSRDEQEFGFTALGDSMRWVEQCQATVNLLFRAEQTTGAVLSDRLLSAVLLCLLFPAPAQPTASRFLPSKVLDCIIVRTKP